MSPGKTRGPGWKWGLLVAGAERAGASIPQQGRQMPQPRMGSQEHSTDDAELTQVHIRKDSPLKSIAT